MAHGNLEYQAVAVVEVYGGIIDYNSGWCASAETAKAELWHILEKNLPAGMYNMAEQLKMRQVQ